MEAFQVLLFSFYFTGLLSYLGSSCNCYRIGESAATEVKHYTCQAKASESRKRKKREFVLGESETDDYRETKRLKVDETINGFRRSGKMIMETDNEELIVEKNMISEHVGKHVENSRGVNKTMNFFSGFLSYLAGNCKCFRIGESNMEVKSYTCEDMEVEYDTCEPMEIEYYTCVPMEIEYYTCVPMELEY